MKGVFLWQIKFTPHIVNTLAIGAILPMERLDPQRYTQQRVRQLMPADGKQLITKRSTSSTTRMVNLGIAIVTAAIHARQKDNGG
jgi:hypothetical protein